MFAEGALSLPVLAKRLAGLRDKASNSSFMKTLAAPQLDQLPRCPGLLDTHIHLDSCHYQTDLPDVLERARQVGVTHMLIPSTDLESSRTIAALTQKHPQLRGALGIHPHQAAGFDPARTPQKLREMLPLSHWVAIGETGLECHYDFCPIELQIDSLKAHLGLARETELPLILHCRLAEELLYDILCQAGPGLRGVVHCFTGGWEWAQKFLDLGFYLGIGGLVTLPKAHEVHEVAARVAAERWLLETDGPYLSPVPYRGYRNESCLLPLVVDRLNHLRQQSQAHLATQARDNAQSLFGCWSDT